MREPCAECGDAWGHVRPGYKSPIRINAARFGLGGVICEKCYMKLRYRKKKGTGTWTNPKRADVPLGFPLGPVRVTALPEPKGA